MTATDQTPERPRATNVIEALGRVAEELPGIGRTERSEQGYDYRGIEGITRHAQQLFGRHGVVFVPKVLDRQVKDLTINGRPWTEEQLTVVYTVYGPGGLTDCIEVGPLIGLGRDNSDKGVNKAMTQVFKYALIQTLCQPTGTMVRVPAGPPARRLGARQGWTEVPIESLRPGDKVVSWGWDPAVLTSTGRAVMAVRSRPYDGVLVTAQVGSSLSRYTPDHRCIVRLGRLSEGNEVVYLMRRGDQYRVGRTSWVRSPAPSKTTPHYGAVERLTAQGADALWVLGVYETAAEAALHEALVAVRFGIPDVAFTDPRSRFDLNEFWMKVGPNGQQGEACLAFFGLLRGQPLLRRPTVAGESWLPLDGVAAANLRSGMLVGVPGEFHQGTRRWRVRWEPVVVGRDYYCGLVHSLDVAGEHTYVADGIGTHNCIGDGKDDPDREKAHEADAHVEAVDPDVQVRRDLRARIAAYPPAVREKVRAFVDEHGIPRVVQQLDDEQVETLTAHLDDLDQTLSDEAEPEKDSPTEPSLPLDGPETPPDAPESAPEAEDAQPPPEPPTTAQGDTEPTDEAVAAAIAHVQAIADKRQVVLELGAHGLATTGNEQSMRKRLALFYAEHPDQLPKGEG